MGDVSYSAQIKFLNNLQMELQQSVNPLDQAVVVQNDASAELVKAEDILGSKAAQEADERYGDTVWNPSTYDGVWIAKKNELYDAEIVDNADRLATAIDLGGAAVVNGAAVIQRARIQRTLEGFYGDIRSGKADAIVSTSFPSANYVAVDEGAAAATYMNVAKIRAANLMLRQNYVPMGRKKWMVITGEDNDALLTEIPATHADFQPVFKGQTDGDGNLTSLLGWNFINLELDDPLLSTIPDLATDSNGYRLNPFWVYGGLVRNDWQKVRTEVGKIPQKQFNPGYFSGTTCAASRTQAGMAGIIRNLKYA